MIRLAGATFSFGDLTLEESGKVVKELGFDLVDVGAGWNNYHQIIPQEAIAHPGAQSERLLRVMDEYEFGVSELFVMQFDHPISHPDDFVRANTLWMFDRMTLFAQKVGFESIMMLPGFLVEEFGQTPEEVFDVSVEALGRMVKVAEAKGIQCNIEPCKGSIANHPDDAIQLCEAVPGLGLTLDYAHQVLIGLGHDEIEPLHPYAKHFHAKQARPDAFMARPDEGAIDFGRLVRKLKEEDYDGVICIEFVESQEVLDAGWDLKVETARLKQVVEEALAAA